MNTKLYIAFGILFLIGHLTATSNHAATFVVTNNADSGAGSLRQAVISADASGNVADTIVFTANVRGKILLTGFEIELNKPIGRSLTIEGPGAEVLSIESNFAHRIFRAQLGNLKISGLRISRGFAPVGFPDSGGGIWVADGASLMLESCSITENRRGGIYTDSGSTLTINNSVIAGNSVGSVSAGGISAEGDLSISNSTIADNFSDFVGGINWGGSLSATAVLTNVTVSGNRGVGVGGVNVFGTMTMLNSTIARNFAHNTAPMFTGGLRTNDTSVNLKNTIIANNNAFTPDVNGHVTSQGNNLMGNTTGGSGFITSDLLNVNPRLGGFANNGGATYSISLLSTSPTHLIGKKSVKTIGGKYVLRIKI